MTSQNVNCTKMMMVDTPVGNTQDEDHLFSNNQRNSETNCPHVGCRTPSRLSCSIICLLLLAFIGALSALIALFLNSKSTTLVSQPLFLGCSGYPSYSQIHKTLEKLHAEFEPNIKLETIGQSFEKRNLTIARLSTDFFKKKPIVWIQCGAHGRETTTPVTCLTLVYNLAIQISSNFSTMVRTRDSLSVIEEGTIGAGESTERTCIFESESWKFPQQYQKSTKFFIDERNFGEYEFIILPLVNPDGYQFALRQPTVQVKDKVLATAYNGTKLSNWNKHPGCWSGESLQKGINLSLSSCKDACHKLPECQGIIRKSSDQTANGICFLRMNINVNGCARSFTYDLYQKMDGTPFASPLVAPRIPSVTKNGYGDPLWRKNRNNSTNPQCKGLFQAVGVDLNRNYDVGFYLNLDERKDPCSNGYGGIKPFSEYETRAISNKLVEYKGNIASTLDIHSFMPALLFPTQYKISQTNHSITTEKIVSQISSVTGAHYASGSGPSLTYFCSGTFMDWTYEKLGCHHSYTMEIRSPRGTYLDYKSTLQSSSFLASSVWKYFQPDFSHIPQISDEAWVGLLALLDQL